MHGTALPDEFAAACPEHALHLDDDPPETIRELRIVGAVHGVLLEPLPYADPDRLVQIWEVNPARNWTNETVAPANFLDWYARSRSFASMAY